MLNKLKGLLAAGALLSQSALVLAAPLQDVKLGYLPVTGHAKFFVAKEEGLFKDEGLNVELFEFTNSADGISAVLAGRLDVGAFGTSAPLVHYGRGAELKVIGGIMGEDAYLVTRPELADQIKGVTDLKGKKVGTVRLASGDAILRSELHKADIDWRKELTISELRNPPAVIQAVKNGQVDAGVVWGPHDRRAEAEGLKIVLSSSELQPGHPCCRVVIASDSAEDTEKWQSFLRALLKAQRFAEENPKATVAAIQKYVPLDEELIQATFYRDTLDQSSDPNVEGVVEFWNAINEAGFVESQRDIADIFDVKLYRAALQQLIHREPKDNYWKSLLTEFDGRNAT
jgi:NitT/TauT family transport system substrate-binding protein